MSCLDLPLSRSALGAGGAWAGDEDEDEDEDEDFYPTPRMVCLYHAFSDLGRISARFAARLRSAGVLTALMRLHPHTREQCWESAGLGAGSGAGDATAQVHQVGTDCPAIFGRSVPRVRRRAGPDAAGRVCRGCMLAPVAHPHPRHAHEPGTNSSKCSRAMVARKLTLINERNMWSHLLTPRDTKANL